MLSNCMKKINLEEHPQLLEQWDFELNAIINHCSVKSSQTVWWKCNKGSDHRWLARVCDRLKSSGCPCCGNRIVVPSNCLATTHPELAKQWDMDRNEISPKDVTAGSNKFVWWRCLKHTDHVWRTQIVARVRYDSGCPFCAGKRSSSVNNLLDLHPEVAKEWNYEKNSINPSDVTSGSAKLVWWKCDRGHSWRATVNNRTSKSHPCPYCMGRKADESTSLLAKYPELCEEWDDSVPPSQILPNSHRRFWWKCRNDSTHRWRATPNNRVSGGSGCPMCNESGGERIINRYLQEICVVYSRQYRLPDCKRIRSLPFDFAVHVGSIVGLVEFQGGQHYQSVAHFGGDPRFVRTKENDVIKKEYCESNKIPLLIIPYNKIKDAKGMLFDFVESLRK